MNIPVVGMGVTQQAGSDRYPFTIIEVVNDKTIIIQEDNAELVEGGAYSEHQVYEYSPNPEGDKVTLTLRKYGNWRQKGEPLHGGTHYFVGRRSKYLDPCF
jgi:hypothetical protein